MFQPIYLALRLLSTVSTYTLVHNQCVVEWLQTSYLSIVLNISHRHLQVSKEK